jgi:putative oxidoreductase
VRGEDLGKLILRFTVGALMLLHGISKIRHGVGGIVTNVGTHSLPSWVAYGVYIGEVVAPLLLCLGWMTRPAALIVAFNMGVAVWLVHMGDLARLGKGGGYALELQLFYGLGALAVALLGAGAFSVSRGQGRLQ